MSGAAREDVVVCRSCGGAWAAAEPGSRCPNGDGGALVRETVHFEWPGADMLGRVLAGRYPLLDVLGIGGMGAVYRGIQEPVGRAVAIKVIRPERDNDLDLAARFKREAQVVAGLTDPAVVTLHDYGESDGVLFMVFELIEGQHLASLMRRESLSTERAVDIAVQICGALAEAHALGLVHRDLKPANIMLHRNRLGEEKVKVLDFGIAKLVAEGPTEIKTREGIVLGTPPYMSPEQARDGELDGRSDLYAVGVLLYEMVTGAPPFRYESSMQTLMAHLTEAPPPIASSAAPLALRELIERALSKRPDRRFESAEAFAEALGTIGKGGFDPKGLADIGTIRSLMPPDGTPVADEVTAVTDLGERAAEPEVGGSRMALWIGIGVFVAALVGAGAFFWGGGAEPTEASTPVKVEMGAQRAPSLDEIVAMSEAGQGETAVGALLEAYRASGDRAEFMREARRYPALSRVVADPRVRQLK